jgi:hypothetical protein
MKKLFPILVALNFIFLECDIDNDIIDIIDIDENKSELFIPEIIETVGDEASIELTMQATETEFFRGVFSDTFGYNGNFLGPTLKVYNKQSITLRTNNRIGEPQQSINMDYMCLEALMEVLIKK